MENKKETKTVEEPQERLITLKYTEAEIASKVRDLQMDEELNLYVKVKNGERKYEEFVALQNSLQQKEGEE